MPNGDWAVRWNSKNRRKKNLNNKQFEVVSIAFRRLRSSEELEILDSELSYRAYDQVSVMIK